jgi:hypothetical protein
MGSGISFLTGAVVGANEIMENNLKQENKLKEIQWQLSRQSAFDTIKRFQETYASEKAKAAQAEQNMRALRSKGLHPVAINKAFEMGMDMSKPETEEYIRGMKIKPKATQTAQPTQPMQNANPMGMPTTNSPAMQGNPQQAQPQGTGATGFGSGAMPMPQGQMASPQQQQQMAPAMGTPAAQGVQQQGMNTQNVQATGIPRGKPKNLPDIAPLQNAYETLGYKDKELQKQLAPFQNMDNGRAKLLETDGEEFEISLPPPKTLQDASLKAQTMVMQNLDRINSAEEAIQTWAGMMKGFQVNDADMARLLEDVRPAFTNVPKGFWGNMDMKKQIAEGTMKALGVELAQQYIKLGQPDKAEQVLVKTGAGSLSDIMGLNKTAAPTDKPQTLDRRDPVSRTASTLDPNPGFNQIRQSLAIMYPGNVMINRATGDIELKNFTPELLEEINGVHTRATEIYQQSLREEGGKIVSITPARALSQAYDEVTFDKASKAAYDKFAQIVNSLSTGNVKTGEDATQQALKQLTPRQRSLVIRYMEANGIK